MGDEYDLYEIQARVNASKDVFLDALNHFDSYDGDQIIERFLAKFDDRSDVTMGLRRETEDLIRRFSSTTALLSENVAILHIRLNGTILSMSVHIMGSVFEEMGKPTAPKRKASPMDVLRDKQKKLDEARDAMSESEKWAKKTAFEIGVHIERVELLAADVVRARTLMMRAFKDENIGASLKDLVEQLQTKQIVRTGRNVLDGAAERIVEMSKELGRYLIELIPMISEVNLARKLAAAAKGKRVDTTRGGTELMNILLSQLRMESKIIQSVMDTYEAAQKEPDSVDAAIRE